MTVREDCYETNTRKYAMPMSWLQQQAMKINCETRNKAVYWQSKDWGRSKKQARQEQGKNMSKCI